MAITQFTITAPTVVWVTKYLYRILQGSLRLSVREIIAQVAEEMDIKIVNGVLSADHIHILRLYPTAHSSE